MVSNCSKSYLFSAYFLMLFSFQKIWEFSASFFLNHIFYSGAYFPTHSLSGSEVFPLAIWNMACINYNIQILSRGKQTSDNSQNTDVIFWTFWLALFLDANFIWKHCVCIKDLNVQAQLASAQSCDPSNPTTGVTWPAMVSISISTISIITNTHHTHNNDQFDWRLVCTGTWRWCWSSPVPSPHPTQGPGLILVF